LAILVTLLAFGGVFATAGAHAAPVAVVVVAADAADACAERATEIRFVAKYCAKRHAAGLPCAPAPVILPPQVAAFGQVQPPLEISSIVEGARLDAVWNRLYRPPRSALA
jgi:hypothetical protein